MYYEQRMNQEQVESNELWDTAAAAAEENCIIPRMKRSSEIAKIWVTMNRSKGQRPCFYFYIRTLYDTEIQSEQCQKG